MARTRTASGSLVKLKALRDLATRTDQRLDNLRNDVDSIEIPTLVSELENDADYQNGTQVETAVQKGVAESNHLSMEVAETIPTPETAKPNVQYLVKNAASGHYDIYALVGDEVVLLDDTTVDLTGYVEKEAGMGLSQNSFTDEEKAKLAGIQIATDEEVEAMLDEVFGA